MYGREDVRKEIISHIATISHGLITITGPGGVGKTRLALEAIQGSGKLSWTVDLVPLTEPDQVERSIEQAIGIEPTSNASLGARIAARLRTEHAVLLLDNVEHLMDATTTIQNLLETCPTLAIVVTSRVRLRLPDEYVVDLQPLDVPEGTSDDLDRIASAPAVQLFLDRCQRRDDTFVLTPGNAAPIAELCQIGDGLPLAIELIASHIQTMTPSEMLRHAQELMHTPHATARDLPSRHRTMHRAIDWSYALLTPAGQRLVRRCAIFAGTFSREAISAVAGKKALTALQEVIDAHLIAPVPDLGGSQRRFAMFETVRQYARDRLIQSGDEDKANRRLIRHVEDCVATFWADRWEPDFAPALDDLREELDTIRVGFAIAEVLDPPAAIRIALGMEWYGFFAGVRGDSYTWLHRLLPYAADDAIDRRTRLHIVRATGNLAIYSNELADSLALLKQADAMLTDEEDPFDVVLVRQQYGLALSEDGQLDAATDVLNSALPLAVALDHWVLRPRILANLGTCALFAGRLDEAEAYLRDSLDDLARHSPPETTAGALHYIGYVHALQGRFDEGREEIGRAISLLQRGQEGSRLFHIQALARLENLAGRPNVSAELIPRYLPHRLERQDFLSVRSALCDAAMCLMTARNPVAAATCFGAGRAGDFIDHPMVFFTDQVLGAMRRLRSSMPSSDFANAFRSGEAMSFPDAVTYALDALQVVVQAAAHSSMFGLTTREMEVLRLIVLGYTDRQIADELSISHLTAQTHVRHVRTKLGVSSRAAAVAVALRHELVDNPD
jgi:non-specific serine/threonine protein kinase